LQLLYKKALPSKRGIKDGSVAPWFVEAPLK